MDDLEFRLLYERTARPLRAYLYRILNDLSSADDILQETYLRFLRARPSNGMTEEHRKNYLFRIATNLLHDRHRTRETLAYEKEYASASDVDKNVRDRCDCARSLAQLTPQQRELLWLAYVEEWTHKEIANATGLSAASIKPLLSRARERLSGILKAGGWR